MLEHFPPIDLYLNFEIPSLKYQVQQTWFLGTWFLV